MPGLNRTGPNSEGPMTGRRMGRCTNRNITLEDDPRFFGRGRGHRGRGHRRRYFSDYHYLRDTQPSVEQEKQNLKNSIRILQDDLDYMTKRLEELESSSDKDE